jgi:hypothetical protein
MTPPDLVADANLDYNNVRILSVGGIHAAYRFFATNGGILSLVIRNLPVN